MSHPAPFRAHSVTILPVRDGEPAGSAPLPLSHDASTSEILRCADTLGIPWKRVLLGEIESEQRLRRYLADIENDGSLPSAMTVLSFSFLQSWRVRDQIRRLAEGAPARGAVRQLRIVFRRLAGKPDRDQVALAEHLWFAYQRVLLLLRVCRAAARSRGTMAERLALTCSTARCCYEDAAWAIRQEESPRRGQRLEAAVQKVRDEGFLIPRAETEARSLAELRRVVRASQHRIRQDPALARSRDRPSVPRRLRLSDAI